MLYFWSSKIINNKTKETTNNKTKYSGILQHTEISKNWILDSNVCFLGHLSFFIWTIILIINLFYKINVQLLEISAFFTIFATAILNIPLFVRSLPAFIILLIIIYY